MYRNRIMALLAILLVASLVLGACAPSTPTETDEPTDSATDTDDTSDDADADVIENPEGQGGFLDQIVMSVVAVDQAVTQISAGAIDLYATSLASPAQIEPVAEAGLNSTTEYGGYYELTINPAEYSSGILNPFSIGAVREAMHFLIDRHFIVQEIYGGNAAAKWFPLNANFPDYAKYVDVARPLEAEYGYDFARGEAAITEALTAAGAELVDGVWSVDGAPLEVIFLIRTDGDGTRHTMGDYIANQLEDVGFMVTRQYGTASELSPFWVQSDPAEASWTLYTGGWLSNAVSRDAGPGFHQMYSPDGLAGLPLWDSYKASISDEFYQVLDDLVNANYTNEDERRAVFSSAMELMFEHSYRIMLVDQASRAPYAPNVEVAYNLANGMIGNTLTPFTLRFSGEEGGTLNWAASDLYVEPANPIGGSNWVFDAMWQNATSDVGVHTNPHTGIALPQRIERAEVVAQADLPISQTYDWVTLESADEIVVPGDTWIDWDPATETFITMDEYMAAIEASIPDLQTAVDDLTAQLADAVAAAEEAGDDAEAEEGEEPAEGEEAEPTLVEQLTADLDAATAALAGAQDDLENFNTALVKSTAYYPDSIYTTTWHDGSTFDAADMVMMMIMTFAPGTEGSDVYDESAVGSLNAFKGSFRGFNILSTEPLVVEAYSTNWQPDAENNVTSLYPNGLLGYAYGTAGWHNMAVSNLAEADEALAYTVDKADALGIEWTNYIAGPSLEVLAGYLEQAAADGFIPYAATMGEFVTAEEAAARYANLQSFFGTYGHFWIGTGPYVLDTVLSVEKQAVLVNYAPFIDSSDKWAGFAEPKLATVEVDGGGLVTIGDEATFDVFVSAPDGNAYPADEIAAVKYLLYDATGALVEVGEGTLDSDGHYIVTLSSATTGALAGGSNTLEVAVTPIPAAVPSFATFEFVTE